MSYFELFSLQFPGSHQIDTLQNFKRINNNLNSSKYYSTWFFEKICQETHESFLGKIIMKMIKK